VATQLKSDDRFLFCFIGGGPRSGDVKAEVKKRELRNVEFRDYVPEKKLPQVLTAPDVHLVTLRSDLAGLSVPSKTYGILAAGKPIAFVGPRESDVASIVSDHGCGVHVHNGDVGGLVQAIRGYEGSSDMLARHQVAARRAFDDGYTQGRGLESITALISG
jgi:colanic acid biosynthesis glycosyl transferase WcaI